MRPGISSVQPEHDRAPRQGGRLPLQAGLQHLVAAADDDGDVGARRAGQAERVGHAADAPRAGHDEHGPVVGGEAQPARPAARASAVAARCGSKGRPRPGRRRSTAAGVPPGGVGRVPVDGQVEIDALVDPQRVDAEVGDEVDRRDPEPARGPEPPEAERREGVGGHDDPDSPRRTQRSTRRRVSRRPARRPPGTATAPGTRAGRWRRRRRDVLELELVAAPQRPPIRRGPVSRKSRTSAWWPAARRRVASSRAAPSWPAPITPAGSTRRSATRRGTARSGGATTVSLSDARVCRYRNLRGAGCPSRRYASRPAFVRRRRVM